jgi:hypothetical protein
MPYRHIAAYAGGMTFRQSAKTVSHMDNAAILDIAARANCD